MTNFAVLRPFMALLIPVAVTACSHGSTSASHVASASTRDGDSTTGSEDFLPTPTPSATSGNASGSTSDNAAGSTSDHASGTTSGAGGSTTTDPNGSSNQTTGSGPTGLPTSGTPAGSSGSTTAGHGESDGNGTSQTPGGGVQTPGGVTQAPGGVTQTPLSPGKNNGSASTPAVTLAGVSYAGAACPAGSVGSNIATDGLALTLLYSDFTIDAAANAKTVAISCQVTVQLTTPAGWQATLVSLQYRGFAAYGLDATGKIATTFDLNGDTATEVSSLPTAAHADFEVTQQVNATTWSKCGSTQVLTMTVLASLTPGTAEGEVTVDSQDAALTHTLGLAWRQCH